jgi:hypothetical protein
MKDIDFFKKGIDLELTLRSSIVLQEKKSRVVISEREFNPELYIPGTSAFS